MPKQEYKILEFHGGSNNKFDARDIPDNQNVFTQFSVDNPGRLTLEGSALTLYDATNINRHTITDIDATSGGFELGHGLFSFSHDYDMDSTPQEVDTNFICINDANEIDIHDRNKSGIGTEIVQNGDDPDPGDSNWAAVNSDGSGTVAWSSGANPSVFDTSANEDASIYNTLSGDALQANVNYILTFEVVTATLNLAIGGGDASGNTADETYVAAADYAVGKHTVSFTPAAAATHLWFTADSSEIAADGSIDNVSCSISGWNDSKFTLGSRTATVKPEYYNADGALRVCDSNFSVTDASIDTAADITKDDITLTLDNGGGDNVTIADGTILQIDQEIVYIPSGATGTSFKAIRGYANTKIAAHDNNTDVYYVNVPKYFGHIKQDRLFECATSNSINTWVEDIQTPQPPNNTRKSDGTTGTLANSAGIQSLRIYDSVTSSTSNYPAESEKVVVEFGETSGNTGIIKIEYGDYSGANFLITTSGYGNNASADHRLQSGDLVDFTDMQGVAAPLAGEHEVVARISATQFTIFVEDGDSGWALDYEAGEQYESSITDWADYSDEQTEGLKIICGTSDDDFTNTSPFPVHITGETGVDAFNGIYTANRIDDDSIFIHHPSFGSHASGSADGQVHQLVGIIRPVDFEGVINEDLKRKWNFAMSFTYDGPGQEVQESLLTQGYKITEAVRASGSVNRLTSEVDNSTDPVTVAVDDGSVFSAGDIIMLGTEQLQVGGVSNNDLTNCVRKFNNTAIATHANDTQVYRVEELTPSAAVDWTNFVGIPKCVIKTVYNHGVDEKTWNPRINGFKIYMRDVTDGDESDEWRLFSHVNFNKGTYTLFAADDAELILEQPATSSVCTVSDGTFIKIKPIDTYLSENLFTEQTIIEAQYKASCIAGRKAYIGNIRQGGRTYPDRMIRTPVNKFDTFPETNFIDVAIGDGDAIVKLMSFGDRLIQFKKNKVYVINISGESEVLEGEYANAGIYFPSQACKTDIGIAWINPAGLWFFDGQSVQNLTRQITTDALGYEDGSVGVIGFDRKTNRVIFTPKIAQGLQSIWYIYDLELRSLQRYYAGHIFPFSDTGGNFYSNISTDANGDMIVGYVDSGYDVGDVTLNFYKWDNANKGHYNNTVSDYHKSKDIDFGSPAVRKKIHKIYVTYKCTGHSGIKLEYATNGGSSFSGFSSSLSTNYNVDSFSAAGDATGFSNSSGEWAVAELKPSSSINNIYSIQLKFSSIIVLDTAVSSGTSNDKLVLNPDPSVADDGYNDYNIYIDGGTARFNSRKIKNYVGGTAEIEVDPAFSDLGYTDAATATTKVIIGSPASDFEINDITIVYRPKPIK